MNTKSYMFFVYIFLICLFSLFFVTGTAYCDNSSENFAHETEHEGEVYEENESFGELGSLAGWLTVGLLTLAIAPLPLRKIKPRFPKNKILTSLKKVLKQSHYTVGILAAIMALIHGTLMLYREGNNASVWLGIMAGTAMVFVAVVGAIIKWQKKYFKFSLNIHKVSLVLLLILFSIHVFE